MNSWKVLKRYWLVYILFILFFLQFVLSRFTLSKLPLHNDSVMTLISVCIGSLSSILGIVVAVLLLGITLSEQSLGNKMKYVLLKDNFILNYFIVSIASIILFVFVNFIYDGTLNNLIVNLLVYALILYIISIILIYPLIKSSLQKTSSKKHLDRYIFKLNRTKGMEYLNGSFEEENEFFILEEVGLNAIKTSDRKMFIYIVKGIKHYIVKEINNSDSGKRNSIRTLLNSFVKIQDRWIKSVNPSEQEWVSMVLIETYGEIKIYSLKRGFGTSNFFEYNNSVENIIKRSSSYFQFAELYSIHNVFKEIYRVYLEVLMPDENKTFLDYKSSNNKDRDYSGQLQWHSILWEFPAQFNRIVRLNKFVNEEVIECHVIAYNNILEMILENNSMTNKQKVALTRNWANALKNFIGEAVSENLNYTPNFVTALIFPDFKGKDIEAYLWLLNTLSEVILYLPKFNKLNKYIINNFGAMGRMNLELINKHESAKLMVNKIANILFQIAKKVEADNNLVSYSNYIELYLEIKSFIDFGIKEKNQVSEDVLKVWRDLLQKLNKYEEFKERLEKEEYHFDAYFK